MKRNLIVLGIATFGIGGIFAGDAMAQGNLMDMGKGLLQNQMGGAKPQSGTALGAGLSTGEIGSGLKEALSVATDKVTSRLGAVDGFNGDPAVHIPLPDSLKMLQKGMKAAGQSAMLDDLELKLNRAAESAAPKAKQIFLNALSSMSLDDARGILNGPKDAATQYFKRSMSPDLKSAMRPVIDKTVADSGAVKAYSAVSASATALPIVGQTVQTGPGQLTDHVLDYAIGGIFKYLGDEEAAIRSDPAKQSTQLLRKLFGG